VSRFDNFWQFSKFSKSFNTNFINNIANINLNQGKGSFGTNNNVVEGFVQFVFFVESQAIILS
jgi:hypothetical protein